MVDDTPVLTLKITSMMFFSQLVSSSWTGREIKLCGGKMMPVNFFVWEGVFVGPRYVMLRRGATSLDKKSNVI